MTFEQKVAIDRLTLWSENKPGGMDRMTKIWKHPAHMAGDVRLVLDLLAQTTK